MSIFQIIAILFALIMIYIVSIHKFKARLSIMEVSFWYSMWAFFIFIAAFPNIMSNITGFLMFSRVFDLVMFVSLMIITWLVVSSYFMQRENMKKIEDLVRKQALDEKQNKSK